MALIVLSQIGLLILLINVLLYSAGFFSNGKAYRIFAAYLFIICIIQVLMEVLASRTINNHFLSGYYLFFQFILLSGFFYTLNLSKAKKAVILYLSLLTVAVLFVQYWLHPDLYYGINSWGFLGTTIILVLYSVLYIFEHLTQKLPFFYVTVGIFIYLISSSLIFASASAVVTFSYQTYANVFNINAVLFILYQLLILWEWKMAYLPKAAN
jgi:hypothetical protein